ncbi:MAG TPA: tetratricopeptide repeat protein [Candidatus Acidoferrum sp.]|nr:tetratricopeptide repeat protein [Candidatus Acidoferrum sp.]
MISRTKTGTAAAKRWLTHPVCLGVLLAAAVLGVFWPAVGCKFINLDDPLYVCANPHVQGGLSLAGLVWAFTADHATNWHPLTWLSHQLDCQVYGLTPAGHHLTSVLLHAANAVLLYIVLRSSLRSRGSGLKAPDPTWACFLVAALFALHPLRAESVAWVSERKDVLSGLFFMLTLWAYVRSAEWGIREHPTSNGHAPRKTLHAARFAFYILSLLFFALGLMSKPMLVTVPFLLLLLDYWPLGRFASLESKALSLGSSEDAPRSTHHAPRTTLRKSYIVYRIFLEKLPFFALSLASCIVTLRVQAAGGAVESLAGAPLAGRLANAVAALAAYLKQTVWPSGLAVFYPLVPIPAWQLCLPLLVLIGLTALCIWQWQARPWLLVGWAWFCIMLLPVIGLVQVGWQARADRYTYLPSIGLFLMVVCGVGSLGSQGSRLQTLGSRLGTGFALAVLVACAATTLLQLRYWQDSERLFRHALAVTRDNWLAHNNLATDLAEQGDLKGAAEHFRAALQIKPGYDDACSNLGRLLALQGNPEEGRALLEGLVGRSPRHPGAHRNLGSVYLAEGRAAEGVAEYTLARQLQPEDETTPADLAASLAGPAAARLALPELREALHLLPTAALRAQVAGKCAEQGNYPAAIEAWSAALVLQPHSPDLLNNLAWLLATCPDQALRNGAEAVRLAEQACELTGRSRTLMLGTLAAAYAEAGKFADAVSTAQKACARATAAGDKALAARNAQLLELYRSGHPYHEPPPARRE